MGTFEKIRKTSPYFLALFAIVFIGFMVASDANISDIMRQGSSPQTAVIASINGQDILYREYESQVAEILKRQRENAGENATDIDEQQIRRSVWSQITQEMLLTQEAEKSGIFVSNEEVTEIMMENPPENLRANFTDTTGNFNRAAYISFITKPEQILERLPQNMSQEEKNKTLEDFREYLITVEKDIRTRKLNEKMMTLVNTAGTFISPLFANQKYKDENTPAAVSFVYLDANQVPDNTVKVTEDEIKKYYDDHKQYFPQKPARKMKYVVFPLIPSDKDSAAAEKVIRDIVTELQKGYTPGLKDTIFTKMMRKHNGEIHDFAMAADLDPQVATYLGTLALREVAGPIMMQGAVSFLRLDEKRTGTNEQVKASHILIGFGQNKDSAKAEAQKLVDRAKTEDFAELARTYSEDKGSAANGGDLGYFGKGRMVKEFEDAAFGAAPGSVVGPVESQFGYHIIKVTDKKSEEIKYSEIKVVPQMSRMTQRTIKRNAELIKRRVEEGQTFEQAAKFFNKPVTETNFIEANRPALGSLYLTAKAFEAEVGNVLEPMEINKSSIVVAQLADIAEEGYAPLKALRDQIRAKLVKIKKLDAMKSKAQEVYNKAKGLDSLSKLTQIDPSIQVRNASNVTNVGFVPGLGQDFVFSAKSQMLPVGQISEPIRGEMGYYIIQVTDRKSPQQEMVKNAINEYMNTLVTNAKSNNYYEWFSKLIEEANIDDHRSEFYREY